MSQRSQRLRARTPTSYAKYNLDFNKSSEDEEEEEESADTFQCEPTKPAFSLKIKRKLRQTLDLIDLSPNKDETELEEAPKSILRTPSSTRKTRKKASQFMPKVDKIEYDPTEPARKLVRAKRRLERQDQVEEECDKYFDFKIEETICDTLPEEIASSDDHVLAEVRTRRSTRNDQCKAQVDDVQSTSRKSSCASELLNKTSKTPKSAVKNGRSTSKTPKSAVKNGRSTSKSGRKSAKLASPPNDLAVVEKKKSPKTPQSVFDTEHVSGNLDNEAETLQVGATATSAENEEQSHLKRASLECETLKLENPCEQLNKTSKTPKSGRTSRKPVKLESSPCDLVVAEKEKPSKTPQNAAKTDHVLDIFQDETEALQADTVITTSIENVRQSRVESTSQKCNTPELDNYASSVLEDHVDAENSNRFSTATGSTQVDSTTFDSVEKKRQSRISRICRIAQECNKTPKPETRCTSIDKEPAQKQDKKTTNNTPQSSTTKNNRQYGSVGTGTAKITPKSVEKKRHTRIAEKIKTPFKHDGRFSVNTPQDKKSTKQTPKSCNKSNYQTNISGNAQNETEISFDMFDNSVQIDSSTFNAEETLAVSKENSLKTYERKSKDRKHSSTKDTTFEKEPSMVSTSQADKTFNVGKDGASGLGTEVTMDSGKKKISFNTSSVSGKSNNQDSMELDKSSLRKSASSFSKTPRNKSSEASLKRTTPSSVAKPKRESIISRKRWSLRSNSFSMHLADNDSVNLVSSADLKRKMSLNTPESARIKRQGSGSLLQKNLLKNNVHNTNLKESVESKPFALMRKSGSSTPITKENRSGRHSSIFEELSMSEEPVNLLDTTTPPNDISYELEPEDDTVTDDATIKPKKRRTFELDSSVNDISTLKLVSRRDSKRISGITRSSIYTPPSVDRKVQKFNGSTIVLDDSSIDSSNSVIFVGEYFENKKSMSLNDLNGRRGADESFDVPIDRYQKRKSRSLSNICENTKKSSMFFMPGQHVSTPMPNTKTRKDSLLKQVLSASAATAAQSVSAKKPAAKARNMPNFALIHQRAFDKMEDIAEHKQRKDERAKKLLSGKKPHTDAATMQQSSSSKKKLRFSEDVVEKEKPADFIPLPNTPRPQKTRRTSSITSSGKESTPRSPRSKIAIPNFAKNPAPVFQGSRNKENDSGSQNAWKPAGFTKFGFALKAPIKPIKEREEVKAAIEKTRVAPVNDTNKRRNVIKGVRSNRRFDLLMKMRNKK